MDKNQLIHIGSESVIIIGIVAYFQSKCTNLDSKIIDLRELVGNMQDTIKSQGETIDKLTYLVSSLHTESYKNDPFINPDTNNQQTGMQSQYVDMQQHNQQMGIQQHTQQMGIQQHTQQMGIQQHNQQMGIQQPNQQLGIQQPSQQMGIQQPSQQMGIQPSQQMGIQQPNQQMGIPQQIGVSPQNNTSIGVPPQNNTRNMNTSPDLVPIYSSSIMSPIEETEEIDDLDIELQDEFKKLVKEVEHINTKTVIHTPLNNTKIEEVFENE